MSDGIVRPVNETIGKDLQFVQSYQSIWMSHWRGTTCNTTIQTHSDSNVVGNLEFDYSAGKYNSPNELKVSRSVDGCGKMETKSFRILNESSSMSSESQRSEGLEFQDVTMAGQANRGSNSLSKHGQDTDHMQALRPVSGPNPDFQEAVDCKLGKSADISNHVLTDANLRNLEHEHHHNRSQSEDLVCEGDMDCHSQPERSVNALFKESHTSLLFHSPSTDNHHLSEVGREWFQKMPKCSDIRLFPSQFVASENTEFKKSLYDCYSRQKLPNCVCDVETMRILSTVDSVVEPGGCPRFSQTVHSLLFTEKTDVNLSKENDISRGKRVLGSTPSDLHCPHPFHGQGKQGLKLQSLNSSCNSEGKENFEYVKSSKVTIKNESSSAETDTIDIHSFKEKNTHAGAYSNPSNEAISMDWNSAPGIAVASSKQTVCRYRKAKLPDMNLDLSALPTAVTFSENAGPMSSRTRSLELDIPLAHAEHPKPQSNLSLDGSPVADPSNRRVKRLKLSTPPSSSHDTKSSNTTEYPAHEKMNKFFSRILNGSSTSSEPTAMKPCGKESIASDQRRYLSKEVKALLSHSWIQRWLHNRSCMTLKKSEKVTLQHSTLALEDLQKKQFPSIAAMALMGKAISGFEPCKLQKRGTFTVWNTKAF